MTEPVTPTEAVIARLTVQNEELRREVIKLIGQLRKVEELAVDLSKAARVECGWLL